MQQSSSSPSPLRGEGWGEGAVDSSREVSVVRVAEGVVEQVVDRVAEETPVALVYNGVPQVVMMATPEHLEDLAVGFTLSESIVRAQAEIQSVRVSRVTDGAQVDISIAGERLSELLRRQRNLTGRTGCGVCGVETIDQALRHPQPVATAVRLNSQQLHAALRQLADMQTLNATVGSVHSAAWGQPDQGIQVVREDVGRHNALDKVIGALVRERIDPTSGYFVITSRASYEMVLKAATAGASILVAVSAPTALAIDLAMQSNLTLVGFARESRYVIYAHPGRIEP